MGTPAARLAILDRDGLLNRKLSPRQYVSSWDMFEWVPGAKDGLRKLSEAGFVFAVATVQMGIGLGIVSEEAVRAVHDRMVAELAEEGIPVAGVYVCPHLDSDGCDCRKPKPGLALRAAKDLGYDPTLCWNLGDSPRDVLMGMNAGCARNLLVRSGYAPRPEELAAIAGIPEVADMVEAADFMLKRENGYGA